MPGIDEKSLLKLKETGWGSPMIDYRLGFAGIDSVLKYVRPLVGKDRAFPRFLPTQKSGRWSTTGPPLPNFSANCINPDCGDIGAEHRASGRECWSLRDIVRPDPGYWFLKFDWDAIEAKLAAALSGDEEDLELFARGDDIHTVTICKMFGLPLPPDLADPHRADSCAGWRARLGWGGKDDWRRVAGKTCRYGLAYGTDERAIHQAKDVDQLARLAGLDKAGIERLAKQYLDSKPKLIAFKRKIFEQVIATHETRTFLGRRRRLFVSSEEYVRWHKTHKATPSCREGLNHIFQGAVADMMNLTIIAIKQAFPQVIFGYQSHDGATFLIPEGLEVWPRVRTIVERDWNLSGYRLQSTATWQRVNEDGSHEELI